MKTRQILIMLLGVFCTASVAAQNPIMPEELLRIAESKQCSQVEDFYRRPGPIDPPYLYFPESSASSPRAAFWCQSQSVRDSSSYRLLFANRPKIAGSCPSELNWWNFPGGLSIESSRNVDLAGLRYLIDPSRKRLSGKRYLTGIKSAYDGVESVFYCVDGEWLYQIRE